MKRYRLEFLAIIALAALGSAQAEAPHARVDWYSITTGGGTPVGHASHEVVPRPDGATIIDAQEIDVVDEGTPPEPMSPNPVTRTTNMSWRTERREDLSGRVLSIDSVAFVGRAQSRNVARIEGGRAEITRTTAAETRKVTVTLPLGVRFDSGEGLLPGWNPTMTPRLEFEDFDVDAMGVERVTIEPLPNTPSDADGTITVVRKRYEGSELRAVTRMQIDREGRIVEVTQPMFGNSLSIHATDRDTALASHMALRALASVMMKSPFLISRSAIEGHIRYHFSFRDGLEFAIPTTGDQRVSAAPDSTTVDICQDCGPGLAGDEADLDSALKPTPWLQSDDPRIREIAAPIAALPVSDSRKMELLLEKAKPFLGTVDFTGHYSALETMSRRAADCTDAAVLLAAFGRAAGIPTRVASGLVYSRESYHGVANVFMPHSWTLAFVDGKWRSFDLALDTFDATHIALTIGDGDEMSVLAAGQLAGLLQWDSMAEVRAPSAN